MDCKNAQPTCRNIVINVVDTSTTNCRGMKKQIYETDGFPIQHGATDCIKNLNSYFVR